VLRCYVPTGLPIAPIFEFFTTYAEESNPKLLPTNAFPELTMSQIGLCVGGWALMPQTPLKGLQVTGPKGHWSDIYVECNDQVNIIT